MVKGPSRGRGLLTDLRVDKRLQPTQEEHSANGTTRKVYNRVTFSLAPPAVDDCWMNEGLDAQGACDMKPTTLSDGGRIAKAAHERNDTSEWDGSDPLQPPCGPLLFVAVRADRTRLAGSIVQWVDVGKYNFKFTLKKHYRSDGSVDDIAKGCKVAGRMFGGYGLRAMSLSYFVPLAPGHDETVHVTDFLEVWARSCTSDSVVDVGPGTSISGPVGFAGGECSERGMGGQGGLPATPPDQEVGMSDDSEDDHQRPPSKPGLHGSRRQGLLGESTPRGGGDGKRFLQSEKYWYYPVCGQHNERAAMKVKDHPVFEYYNFYKWSFRPIYFHDDEFDGYAHVSCEDNMKDKKNPLRLQVLSMRGIRNIWKIKGKPHDSVFALGEKFYEEWSKGKLLASDDWRWTKKPPTFGEVANPGLSTVTDSQGLKKHVWYVKVDDPSLKKGKGKPKKGAEEKTFYVQVPEPNVHCLKELVDLTDRKKKRLLNGVLNLNVVWVQTSSKKLAEQGKFSVKEMVDVIKMDGIMLRLWHYVEFKYKEMDKREWNANSTFFRSKKQLLEEFKDKGLDDKLWNESRKFFTDTTYVNKCPQFLGCQHDNNIKRTVALVNDQHFPAEWKRVVVSVITGTRAKGKKNPRGVDECINIMWTRISTLTTLAQFNVDPLNAIDHKEALGKLGHQLRSHTCVLDLCGTVDRAQWDFGAFASLSELLGFVSHDYWTLVVFVPCLWNLSFMTTLSALGATQCYTGKWVRKTAANKTHQFGNSVWEEPDVMHILFKGEDPWLLTHLVYEGAVAEDDVAALHRKQKVTPTDVED
ncbi:hypothetical protein CBR_g31763 [Chara braunii]|uniref:Uncharacterized protein n=1 Tax=Chara braunii TaxID=69332 RepID=A0A388JY65_CHABU|nr:hypothetical protein CBR_g31763 [Chara braunii]|eukprot:GBG62746.1 hypothetical protein CBR_g31763 [Chara braunii]